MRLHTILLLTLLTAAVRAGNDLPVIVAGGAVKPLGNDLPVIVASAGPAPLGNDLPIIVAMA